MIKQSIRVDAIKIDNLMNQVGELVVSRSGFSQLFTEMRELQLLLKQSMKLNPAEMQKIKDLTNRINEATVSLGRVTSELQENVMKVRMLPIAQLFSRYPRLVHDLVKGSQKKVSLEIHGEDTELDKMVIEQIADPLVHIIRNAVDHGIEDVGERLQKGKSEEGMLRLEAYHESNFVVIEISDDGRGMDPEQIKAEALAKSFVDEEEVDGLNEQELLALIMRPGFSTASEVTHTSGRGVGMDVVKDNIEKLNGTIDIVSTIGAGVTFRIKIPLTLAIIPALLVRVQSELFTIPLPTVDETLRIKRDEISTIEGMEVYYLRENTVPLIRLAELFSMRQAAADPEELFVVIINTGARQVGLIVDELRAREEVVIKPLEDYLQEKSGFSGATILGDGSISLILDVYELVQLALGRYAIRSSTATA
jgi:two-component system chemotaxis sensor kinase CheA